jgi:hypothetical protein
MDRSTKKAVAHQGKDDITQGGVDDTPIEGVEPCLVERGNGASGSPSPGIFRWKLTEFAIVTETHCFSPHCACGLEVKLFTKSAILSIKSSHSVIYD